MRDFVLDKTGDIDINGSNGDFTMTDNDKTLLAQQIQSLLNTNYGELSWNEEFGLNHMEIMANSSDVTAVRKIIDQYLQQNLENYSTIDVDSVDFDPATRTQYIYMTVTMSDGTQVSTSIGGDR
ncbi:hypothetical protein [Apilactobacillus nanyangensis]|uniref:hypothetical protein n=1 Tax=Apilactobacillus nanyangensis TaxID=2799579 RepID=UPI001942D527|nr:hypothetical protein [Apilactobacillus nanyangensis]